ncbi:DUF2088 domain-containing protein [Alicyclobacillaceae bacterium I2511]|nr:DUF2088 domain-containing protein [Alicyclobacillaceae bacterium I2511]
MEDVERLLREVPLPRIIPVLQHFTGPRVEDVRQEVRQAIAKADLKRRIQPGARVAVGVGSRGIANLPDLVSTVLQVLQEGGAKPFIFPAMGSHGGATAQGQQAMLAHLGITEQTMGVPVRATMETLQVGTSAAGLPVYVDREAANADGIVWINRIKPHTSFRGTVESGLLKMMVIGFGKQKGADVAHVAGFGALVERLLDIAPVIQHSLPLWFAVGVLENAQDATAKVVALSPEQLLDQEPQLLAEARRLMPRIDLSPLDVLVVDEIGKNISGVGLDPNITGRYPNDLVKGELAVDKLAVLRLTRESDGNAAGIGLADVTTAAAEAQIDRRKGYVNSLTSTSMTTVKLPMVLPNDRLTLQAALKTCHADVSQVRLVRIRNTQHLDDIWVSEALLKAVKDHPQMESVGPAQVWPFDNLGNLTDLP